MVYYQPIARVDNNKITGFEALVRWNHPTRGLLGPLEFVPLAEESDLIFELGRAVLWEACTTVANWRVTVREASEICIAVNLSPRQFHDPDLLDVISSVLSDSGLPPEALTLEITETSAMDNLDQAGRAMMGIRNLGVTLAIDDFGTGHSSLAQLKRIPASRLKIDKAFVDDIVNSSRDQAIIDCRVTIAGDVVMSGSVRLTGDHVDDPFFVVDLLHVWHPGK
jgi:EAL domain-containing protein (putative c-di-GMP-specific phosphodiesterase class I)